MTQHEKNSPELPICSKIEYPCWKLDWGTLCYVYLLCEWHPSTSEDFWQSLKPSFRWHFHNTFRLFILKDILRWKVWSPEWFLTFNLRNCKFLKIKNSDLKMFIDTFQCFRWTNPQKYLLLTTTDMHRFSRGSRTFDQINGCKVCLRVIGIITCHLSHVMITAVIHCLVRKLIRIVYCSWVILLFIKFQFAPLLFFEKWKKGCPNGKLPYFLDSWSYFLY